ncbi:MAG: ribonuclease Z, partial [Gemmatimonadota bacterium]|nr:ribonuclease Z [Gemmatimonadota bacterium]
MGRLTVVGCGTVVPEPERAASCYHVELDGSGVLLDCGPGALQAMVRIGIAWSGITDLALTHFHADHLGAVPGLFFALRHALHPDRRRRPLDVWGPAGTRTLFRRLSRTLGDYIVDPGFPVRVHELGPGDVIGLEGGPSLSAHATPHTDESLAYRLDG